MKKLIFGAVCALFSATAATAQETVTWQDDVAGWNVAVDRTIGNSCFIITAFENDYVVRFQFNTRQQNVQFIIGNIRWGSLETGQGYDMEVAFGERDPWSGEGIGYRWNDVLPTLVLSVPVAGNQASHFIDEFRDMGDVSVSYDGAEIATLVLEGTHEAIAEMMACQAEMLAQADPEDPFVGAGTEAEPL